MIRLCLVVGLVISCTACENLSENELLDVLSNKQAEKWSADDDPSIADDDLIYDVSSLPSQGSAATVPWPGPFWGTDVDAFNFRWSNTASPIKKYETAFELTGLEDLVSRFYGIDQLLGERKCSSDSQCHESNVTCGKRVGFGEGYCIPEWWGYCHAWSAAAIAEPEPKRAVTINGVNFRVNDIKALVTLAYDNSELRFLSNRCNYKRDQIGYNNNRPTDEFSECRDTNPGTFHVMLCNYLGIKRQSFAFDISFDQQVWNAPVRGYNIREMREMSRSEAVSLAGNFFDSDATRFYFVAVDVNIVKSSDTGVDGPLSAYINDYTATVGYQYILEADDRGKIIGGEWIGDSKMNHPDFLRIPLGPGTNSIALGKVSYFRVKQILNASSGNGTSDLVFVKRDERIKGEQRNLHGPFEVAATSGLEVEISGEGNFDLSIYPMEYGTRMDYVCKQARAQTGKTCLMRGPGKFLVEVIGRAWDSRYSLSIFYGR